MQLCLDLFHLFNDLLFIYRARIRVLFIYDRNQNYI